MRVQGIHAFQSHLSSVSTPASSPVIRVGGSDGVDDFPLTLAQLFTEQSLNVAVTANSRKLSVTLLREIFGELVKVTPPSSAFQVLLLFHFSLYIEV